MSTQAAAEPKRYVESFIRRTEGGDLQRVYSNLNRPNMTADIAAEVLVQYLYLKQVVDAQLKRLRAFAEDRFGADVFDQACQTAWTQLGDSKDILHALNLIPWADPDQPDMGS